MTLNTDLIEKESRQLYMRYLKDPRIPDELCSEIYLEFLKRMNNYREKQKPAKGKKHIDGGIIGKIISRATQSVFARHKKQKEKETVLTTILGRNASQFWCTKKSPQEREFFARIAAFLKDWVGQKKQYPDYLRIFLLYHAFHLSPEFIAALAPLAGGEEIALLRDMEAMKETLRERADRELEKKTRTMGTNYFILIKNQIRRGDLVIRQIGSDEGECARVKRNREKAYLAVKELKFVPSWVMLENITGISERKARYAYQCISKAIQESFKDDTYWGRK